MKPKDVHRAEFPDLIPKYLYLAFSFIGYKLKYLNPGIFRRVIKANVFSNFLNLSSIQLSNTVLSFLIYTVVIRKVGLEAFGLFTVSNYFAVLMGTVVNYGTSQSGVKDIVMAREDPHRLSSMFYNTLFLRILIFIAFLAVFSLAEFGDFPNYTFYLFAIPVVFAEALNPIFLYLGLEKLTLYNIANMIAKVLIIIMVIFFIKGAEDAKWVNFILGAVNSAAYLLLVVCAVVKYRLWAGFFDKAIISRLAVSNFYLLGNNISVQLQQSLMVFAINLWGNPVWLGSYAICDKIIGAVKLLIISLCNSIYPKAASLFKENIEEFTVFKKRMKKILVLGFLGLSIAITILAGPIIYLVNGTHDPAAELLLRIMAFLPTVAALNSFNVIELLIRDKNIYIFKIAMILFILAACLSVAIVFWGNLFWFGTYTLLIETCAVFMYEYILKKFPAEYVYQGMQAQTSGD